VGLFVLSLIPSARGFQVDARRDQISKIVKDEEFKYKQAHGPKGFYPPGSLERFRLDLAHDEMHSLANIRDQYFLVFVGIALPASYGYLLGGIITLRRQKPPPAVAVHALKMTWFIVALIVVVIATLIALDGIIKNFVFA